MVEYKQQLRLWKIWYWDSNDKKHTKYVKKYTVEEVVEECGKLNITNYCIFDDKFRNVNNDGISVARR